MAPGFLVLRGLFRPLQGRHGRNGERRAADPRGLPDGLPGHVQLGGHRPRRPRGEARGRSRAPLHARRPVQQAQRLRRVHAVARAAPVPDAARRPKGAGDFERISWDEALDEIAERLSRVIREFGAEAIWPYLGSGSMGLLQGVYGAGRRLWNVVGASRHLMTICTIAGGVGTGYTLGDNRVGMDPETLRFSKLIILWGSNTLTTNHHLWRSITTARQNGAHLVVIDPTRTRTADAADSHLALVPGTDAALALGLLHVVLSEGAEDRDFIDRHTLGWDAFRRRILEYPPERVAEICGLPVERDRGAGEADRPHAPHRHPGDDGPPATRRRRDGGADHHLHPGRHRRLAISRRRRWLRHARLLRRELGGALSGRSAEDRRRARSA